MAAKTRWYNEGSSVLRGAGRGLDDDRPRLPSRARVLRGGAELERRIRSAGPEPVARPMERVRPAERMALRPEDVRIEYDPSRYGLHQAETMEEREARHRAEVDQLKARLADAEKRVEQASKEAYDRGVEAGRAQGADKAREDIEAEYSEHIQRVVELLSTVADGTRDYYAQVDKALARLALNISRRVVGDAAERYEGIVTRLAKEAVAQASERTHVTLLCHPDDESELREGGADLQAASEGVKAVDVTASPRVKRGGVILETNGGSIDATLNTILDELFIALIDEEPPLEGRA